MYRLLVVDDEKIVREGIAGVISEGQDDFQVVAEATDGEKALEIVMDELPDVIVTDINMPRMNGIEFIESVTSINPDIRIIIISGYDEFEYAQKALKLRVTDYLLKPVDPDILLNILKKMKGELDAAKKYTYDMERLKAQVKESIPAVRERFLNNLVTGKLDSGMILQKAELLNMDIRGCFYTVALLLCDGLGNMAVSGTYNEELVLYFADDILKKLFGERIKVQSFFVSDDRIALLICSDTENKQAAFMSVNLNLQKLVSSIHKQFGLNALIFVGRFYEKLEEVPLSYRDAEWTARHRLLKAKDGVANYEEIATRPDVQFEKPAELESRLMMHIRLCEKEQVEKLTNHLFDFYTAQEGQNQHSIRLQVMEIVLLVFKTIEESIGYGEKCRISEMTSYEELFRCISLDGMKNWLRNFCNACMDEILRARSGKKNSIIERAMEIIDASLFDSGFNLEQVAARLFISPNYLRQIFRQQLGKSFVEYLTAQRMEKAGELLEDFGLKVQDIAEQVGYTDPRYFAICFKKAYQMTPSEFREALQLLNGN